MRHEETNTRNEEDETMSMRLCDAAIHEGLTIVDLDGDATWICEQYGMSGDDLRGPGILWTDYDNSSDRPWRFSVLLDGDEAEAFVSLAREAGYEILSVEPVTVPMSYGDSHDGTVEIVKHREGWMIFR